MSVFFSIFLSDFALKKLGWLQAHKYYYHSIRISYFNQAQASKFYVPLPGQKRKNAGQNILAGKPAGCKIVQTKLSDGYNSFKTEREIVSIEGEDSNSGKAKKGFLTIQ
jgi:hypothetical protein